MGILFINNAATFIAGSTSGRPVGSYGGWLGFAFILLVYHIVLVWLVLTAKHDAGISMSIPMTIVTHLSCLVVLVGLNVVGRYLPFFGLIRYCIPALAPFERDWLFKAKPKPRVTQVAAPITTTVAEATADDHAEWLQFVARQPRPFPRPGTTLQSEYERWLVARAKSKAKAS